METIEIKCTTNETKNIAELTELQGNLKARNDIDFDKIKLSIIKYGFSFPFFYTEIGGKNYILDGHGRFATLCKMQKDGYIIPDLPCVKVECKDLKEAKQKLLRLNSQYGKMTKESVLEFAEDIDLNFDEIALPDTTIDFTDQSGEIAETEGDDEAPEVDEKSEPVSKRGEMYELGNSILMCGDSTSAEDVARLMGGEKADMVFTDPPYGIDYSGGRSQLLKKKDYGKLMNDDLEGQDLAHLICNIFEFNKGGADIYICVSPIMQKPFLDFIEKAGKEINAVIVWDKKQAGLGYMAYRRQCEFILFVKGEPFHKGDKTDFDLLSITRDNAENYVHSTQKPVAVPLRAINNSSKQGDLVLDLFGGSGSTLIACEKNNRRARLMELDPHYCDVIRRRYTKWADQNGIKRSSGCLDY